MMATLDHQCCADKYLQLCFVKQEERKSKCCGSHDWISTVCSETYHLSTVNSLKTFNFINYSKDDDLNHIIDMA